MKHKGPPMAGINGWPHPSTSQPRANQSARSKGPSGENVCKMVRFNCEHVAEDGFLHLINACPRDKKIFLPESHLYI